MNWYARLSVVFICLAITAISAPLLAGTPSTQPAPPQANPATDPSLIADLSVSERGMTLGKFLPLLQESAPGFQYVAEPGAWQDFPLPPLRLQHLRVEQVVMMLTNLDRQLQVDEISGNTGNTPFERRPTLYVFKSRAGAGPGPEDQKVMAFGLTDTIDRLALRKAWAMDAAQGNSPPTPAQVSAARQAATDEILSLLQAAISEAPAQEQASLKLHKETEVLLVRGEDRQLKAASQALDALKSADDPKRYESKYIDLLNRHDAAKRALGAVQGTTDTQQKH